MKSWAAFLSWLASDNPRDSRRRPKRPGRRKEEGGHKRIDITVNKSTSDILDLQENKSSYIEYCVNASTFSKKIRFHEPKTTVNDDFTVFETAARFVWRPSDRQNNAILATYCYFMYQCMGKGFKFRMKINGNVTSAVEVLASGIWTLSHVFNDSSFAGGVPSFPNQSRYAIEFQFEPIDSSSMVCVKDVNIILDVVDGMPALFS